MLLTVLIVSGTILGATAIAGLLMLYQLRGATQFGQSMQAMFAADSGLEWKLYTEFVDKNRLAPLMSRESQSDFIVTGSSQPGNAITAVGCSGPILSQVKPGLCPRPVNRSFAIEFQ